MIKLLTVFVLLLSLNTFAIKPKENVFLRKNLKMTEGSRMQLAKYLRENKKNKNAALVTMLCSPSKATTKCEFIEIEHLDRTKSFTTKRTNKLDKLMKK